MRQFTNKIKIIRNFAKIAKKSFRREKSAESVLKVCVIQSAHGLAAAVCMQEGDGGVRHAVEMGCFDDGVVSHVIQNDGVTGA